MALQGGQIVLEFDTFGVIQTTTFSLQFHKFFRPFLKSFCFENYLLANLHLVHIRHLFCQMLHKSRTTTTHPNCHLVWDWQPVCTYTNTTLVSPSSSITSICHAGSASSWTTKKHLLRLLLLMIIHSNYGFNFFEMICQERGF